MLSSYLVPNYATNNGQQPLGNPGSARAVSDLAQPLAPIMALIMGTHFVGNSPISAASALAPIFGIRTNYGQGQMGNYFPGRPPYHPPQ
ncbi:hypothetical protein niasHT_034865 [Heterodera trifolii]|uniref:Uncharacterized protein n=1 Tax=Heterodera trifolii TaxID=157864 RepID=A0ABD2IKL0_9BILA